MLASDDLQLRGKSRCGRCEHRVVGSTTKGGRARSICDLTGEHVHHDTQACRDYRRSEVDAERGREDWVLYRLRHTSAAGQTLDLATRIKHARTNLSAARRRGNPAIVEKWEHEVALLLDERERDRRAELAALPVPAPRPTPTVCPRCGGQLWRDRDSIVCMRCWITILDREPVWTYGGGMASYNVPRQWET